MTISLHMSVCLMQPWQVRHCIAQTEWTIYFPNILDQISRPRVSLNDTIIIKDAKKGTYMVFFLLGDVYGIGIVLVSSIVNRSFPHKCIVYVVMCLCRCEDSIWPVEASEILTLDW